eukprot:GHVR01141912.1.p1 GENE.GHVR01141912.1~~GHVR01141912.1.p1  ORF type:complete len:142 (+),score=20.88 GHVR01141912.1:84-509(+)
MPDVNKETITKDGKHMCAFILASSAVVVTASAFWCGGGTYNGIVIGNNGCSGVNAYAIAVGVISLVVALIMLILWIAKDDAAKKAEPWMSLFLFIWWIPGVIILTFVGPFKSTGNGYFASWCSLILSLVYFIKFGIPKLKK